MILKEIDLRSCVKENAETEIMYEVASARADDIELIRINLKSSAEQESGLNKLLAVLIRLLKNMKQNGQIQFYAVPESFSKMSTEAVFLINKYPVIFKNIPTSEENGQFIFIKL